MAMQECQPGLSQQMDEAGEKVADVIIAASGGILAANSPTLHRASRNFLT
jgi:hypothetical protein